MTRLNNTLTAVGGIRVGHETNLTAATGCTVILCPENTVGGVDVRGGAPGTRETDLLRPMHRVEHVNAIVLSGGSAYGLASADGVMKYLAEQGVGYKTRSGHIVPIVSAAIVFDLALGAGDVYPDAAMGYAASMTASTAPVEQGNVGVGTGCRIGAMLGNAFASKGGVGSAAAHFANGLVIAALVAVNAVGDVIAEDGSIIAGVRLPPDGTQFAGMLNLMQNPPQQKMGAASDPTENTVIGVVASNARLSKEETNKVASMAHDGLARAVRPAHTMYDGDTLFALSTCKVAADVNLVGAFAAEVTAEAIRSAVRQAKTMDNVRGYNG